MYQETQGPITIFLQNVYSVKILITQLCDKFILKGCNFQNWCNNLFYNFIIISLYKTQYVLI